MTESEWLTSTDPTAMLDWRQGSNPLREPCPQPPLSDRKLRLFSCACCRQVWHLLIDDAQCPKCDGGGLVKGLTKRAGVLCWTKCLDCSGSGRLNRSRRAVEVAERFADGLVTEEEFHSNWNDAWDAGTQALPNPSPMQAVSWLFGRTDSPGGTAAEVCAILQPHLPATTQADLLREIVGNPFRPVQSLYVKLKGQERYSDSGATRLGRDPDLMVPCSLWLTPTVLSLATAAYEERLPARKCRTCQGKGWIKHEDDYGFFHTGCMSCGGDGKMTWRDGGRRTPPMKEPGKVGTGVLDDKAIDPVRLAILADSLEEAGCQDEVILQHLRSQPFMYNTGPGDYGDEYLEIPQSTHVRGCWALDLILGKT